MELDIKILGYRKTQRYAVRRAIEQALQQLSGGNFQTGVKITEISEVHEILKYTQVLVYPGLQVSGELVCVGRIPKQDEVREWITNKIKQKLATDKIIEKVS